MFKEEVIRELEQARQKYEEAAKWTWGKISGFDFTDIIYEKRSRVSRITINRPQAFNSFKSSGVFIFKNWDCPGSNARCSSV